ncbi:hypothetical protein IQ266_05045 [filamentous cyanobacterium LEGE 11480]|uniref:Uncharacterized protein n=1 Tax=Romeriopsis navalis LEGE 11480 TaxID=2777977 RepID=A0A928VIA8_9CYAN|nr:hypothetical protein [Romeriopsis navalis]MBE9029128.1 hypothetical protein [Romeriopsis navalis LEGE 11480]
MITIPSNRNLQLSQLIRRYNNHNQSDIEYVMFNQGLKAGLQQATANVDDLSYLQGYWIGQTHVQRSLRTTPSDTRLNDHRFPAIGRPRH